MLTLFLIVSALIAVSFCSLNKQPKQQAVRLALPKKIGGGNFGSAYAYINAKGEVQQTGGPININATRLATGYYCIGNGISAAGLNYASVQVTVQQDDNSIPAYGTANTGSGSKCNGYGYPVQLYEAHGDQPFDSDFTVFVSSVTL